MSLDFWIKHIVLHFWLFHHNNSFSLLLLFPNRKRIIVDFMIHFSLLYALRTLLQKQLLDLVFCLGFQSLRFFPGLLTFIFLQLLMHLLETQTAELPLNRSVFPISLFVELPLLLHLLSALMGFSHGHHFVQFFQFLR